MILKAFSGPAPLPKASDVSASPSRCNPLVRKASKATSITPTTDGGHRAFAVLSKPASRQPSNRPTDGKNARDALNSESLNDKPGARGIMVKN
jgi:hypothetical protein